MFRSTIRGSLSPIVVALFALLGCKNDQATEGGAASGQPATESVPGDNSAKRPADKTAAKPSAHVFSGTLTKEVLAGARGVVQPFDVWAEALPKLEAKLGKATAVDGNVYKWGVVDADTCHYIIVEDDGGKVGTVMGPAKVGKVLTDVYDKCVAAAESISADDRKAP